MTIKKWPLARHLYAWSGREIMTMYPTWVIDAVFVLWFLGWSGGLLATGSFNWVILIYAVTAVIFSLMGWRSFIAWRKARAVRMMRLTLHHQGTTLYQTNNPSFLLQTETAFYSVIRSEGVALRFVDLLCLNHEDLDTLVHLTPDGRGDVPCILYRIPLNRVMPVYRFSVVTEVSGWTVHLPEESEVDDDSSGSHVTFNYQCKYEGLRKLPLAETAQLILTGAVIVDLPELQQLAHELQEAGVSPN